MDLLIMLRTGSFLTTLKHFFEDKNVLETQSRLIYGRINQLISNPLKSAFSYLEMAKNSNGCNKEMYTNQAIFKLVEAIQYIDRDDPEWPVAHKALAMCQYFNKDYKNAIISLDQSLRPIFVKMDSWTSLSPFSSQYKDILSTVNIIAELWNKVVLSDSYLMSLEYDCTLSQELRKSAPKCYDNLAGTDIFDKLLYWPFIKKGHWSVFSHPEICFVEL